MKKKNSRMIIVKLSSFGRAGKSGEVAHLRYIGRAEACRHGLQDEAGSIIPLNEALQKYNWQHKTVSDRLIISLPSGLSEAEINLIRQEMLQELSGRYDAFTLAEHSNTSNVHFHCTVINTGNRKQNFDRPSEIYNLQRALNNELIPVPKTGHRTVTQAEIHLCQRGEDSWKTAMRIACNSATKGSKAFSDWQNSLGKQGVTICRETSKTLTLQDSAGNRCRINKLFAGVKCRRDIETLLEASPQHDARLTIHTPSTQQSRVDIPKLPIRKTAQPLIVGQVNEEEKSWMQQWERDQIRARRAMQRTSHSPSR